MKWIKKGLVYGLDGSLGPWAQNSALQPTPIVMDETRIRVYVGMRDAEGVGRVGYVDVDADDPKNVLDVSSRPALDIGLPGTFDENGVVPTAIVRRDGGLFLYYAGYQLGRKIRFNVFCGLAVSEDDGRTFRRISRVPVLDRTDGELYFRVIHSILYEKDVWRVWYGAGSAFRMEGSRSLPEYNVRYMESKDGIHFPAEGRICVDMAGPAEHRIGRPYVVRKNNAYRMFYGAATVKDNYRLGFADSSDGLAWSRRDSEMGLDLSPTGWDSEMTCYPSVVTVKDKTYLFYNGNRYGYDGFGYAELAQW